MTYKQPPAKNPGGIAPLVFRFEAKAGEAKAQPVQAAEKLPGTLSPPVKAITAEMKFAANPPAPVFSGESTMAPKAEPRTQLSQYGDW